jgi:RimJ/RimL family protein N-acetyltransferase
VAPVRVHAQLQTPRLLLRQWRASDEEAIAAINSDPEVTRYLNRPIGPAASRAFFATVQAHWQEYGYGFWAAESREPKRVGRLLGFIGVGHPSFIPSLAHRLEIGWRLGRMAWGRGLATEGASAVRDHVFAALQVPELISIIHPDNVRSQRVAEKLGMSIGELAENPVMGIAVQVWRIGVPGDAPRSGKPRQSV